MSRVRTTRVAAFAVLILLAAGLAGFGGDEKGGDKKEEKAPPPKLPSTRTTKLVVLVEAKADQSKAEIEKLLTKGAKLAKCEFDGKPYVDEAPASVFRRFRGLEAPASDDASIKGPEVTMRPLPDDPTNWAVRVHGPKGTRLSKLKVKYQGKDAWVEYEPKNPDKEPDAALVQTLPQTSVLRVAKDNRITAADTPAEYTATIKVPGAKAEDRPIEKEAAVGKLDAGPRYYMVWFSNFRGDINDLFEVIKDKDKIGNNVEDAKAEEIVSVVFASWHRKLPDSNPFDGFDYVPALAALNGKRVVRIWINFPLTKAKAEELLAEYRKPDMNETTIVKKIRESSPVRGSAKVVVGAETKNRWIELPDSSTDGKLEVFSRRVNLANFDKLLDNYPEAYRLVVYEFEPKGGKPEEDVEALRFADPVTKRAVYVAMEPVEGWSLNVSKMRDKAKPKAKP